jgi:hypothetical protein
MKMTLDEVDWQTGKRICDVIDEARRQLADQEDDDDDDHLITLTLPQCDMRLLIAETER